MNAVVVDTDAVSLVFKGIAHAEKHMPPIARHDLLFSFITEAEFECWILQANWGGELITRFRVYMKRFVAVPSSRGLIVKWAEIMVKARSLGRRLEVADASIAVTALLYDAPSVTNNPTDYAGVPGIHLLPDT